MHCMQSIPELCSRIACIVGFLVHTMHTARTAWLIALPRAKTPVYVIHLERVECKSPAEMRDVRFANRLTAATVRPYEIVCILLFSVRADEMRGYAT